MNWTEPTTAAVVIATFNRPEHVRRCLTHLTAQTRPADEIVVVDASPDQRTEAVTGDFAGVQYLRNEKGRGFTATSRALGIAATTSEVIAFIDDDAYAAPDWLSELIHGYAHADVAAVGGRAMNNQPGEENEGLDEIGKFTRDGRLTGWFAADPGKEIDVDHLLGANMSVRRDVVDALGGIRDYYPGTCLREESDIALRMRAAGYRIRYRPQAVVEHVAGEYAKGRRFDLRYQYFGERNHIALLGTALPPGTGTLRRYYGVLARSIGQEVGSGIRNAGQRRRGLVPRTRSFTGGFVRGGARIAGAAVGTSWLLRHRFRVGRAA